MNINEIQERARAMGITELEGMTKGEIIRAIQIAEGSRDCYGNLWRFDCLEYDCCWRDDCRTTNPE